MKAPAQRVQKLDANFFASLERQIAALQAAGQDIIRLDVGSPDLPPPPEVVAALAESARRPDSHGYQTHAGPPALRQAWAEMYRGVHGVNLDPDVEVLPLLGSKEGIFHLVQAWVDPGEVVLVPDPAYLTYRQAALFAGAEVCSMALKPERAYRPDFAAIPDEVLRRAKLMFLNYPHNPTTAVADLDFLAEAVAFARRHDLLLCHDAAYTQVVYDGYRAPSVLEVPGAAEVAVEVNSLSKSHNMAGWRVGAALGNRQALAALFRLKSNLDSSHFLPVMQAAIAALSCDPAWITRRNEIYRQRRDQVVDALSRLGLAVAAPKASIYIWIPVPEGISALDFVTALLECARVSLTPGTVFGPGGEGFVRLSLTLPEERIEAAMQRMADFMGEKRWR